MISILSIDGGGMKGIISAKVLMRLEEHLKTQSKRRTAQLVDYFDLIAGTSTGSILSALLLCPDGKGGVRYTATDALNLYLTEGNKMFEKKSLYPLHTMFGLFGAKYKNDNFKKALQNYFGDIRISELLRPCLFPAYDTSKHQTVFFNTLSGHKDNFRNYYVKDAVLASTAAPTYFPPSCTLIRDDCQDWLIDGGVFANNPALCALVEALKIPNCNDIQNTMLLSIGNVSRPNEYTCKQVSKWGIFRWALPLLDILMDASEQTVDYELQHLFDVLHIKDQYLRIALKTSAIIPTMDDTSKEGIKKLIQYGDELVNSCDNVLRMYATRLIQNRNARI